MYESLLSALTGFRIKRVNFRNCPLYTAVRIKLNYCQKKQSLLKTCLTKIRIISALCSVGIGRLLLYIFVTVKNVPTQWSCARRLPGNIGTKVEFQNPLSEDVNELSRKYDLFLFDFFIVCSFIQFHFFFCTYPCASGDLTKQITETSELQLLEGFL